MASYWLLFLGVCVCGLTRFTQIERNREDEKEWPHFCSISNIVCVCRTWGIAQLGGGAPCCLWKRLHDLNNRCMHVISHLYMCICYEIMHCHMTEGFALVAANETSMYVLYVWWHHGGRYVRPKDECLVLMYTPQNAFEHGTLTAWVIRTQQAARKSLSFLFS